MSQSFVDFVGAVGAVFVDESLKDGFAWFGDAETVSSEDGEGGVDRVTRTRGMRFFIVIEHRGGKCLRIWERGRSNKGEWAGRWVGYFG